MQSYTHKEEIANWITHAIGICLSVAGFVVMLCLTEGENYSLKLTSILIYGIALVLLYTSSTLYHAIKPLKLKKKFQMADHYAIFIKIAGTYTPFSLLTLKENNGWILLIIIWVLAVAGILFKYFFGDKYTILSTIIYLAMGWLAILVIKPLFKELPLNGFIFLAAGGISYTIGVIFFLWEKLPYSHSIWHLFVLGGSIFHYFAILLFVI